MKKPAMKAAGLALAFSLFAMPAMAQDGAKKQVEKPADKCTMTIRADIDKEAKGFTRLSLTPVHEDALYNWRVSAGTINSGQGTPTVLVMNPPPGADMTVEVDAIDRPSSCPEKTNHATLVVKYTKPEAPKK